MAGSGNQQEFFAYPGERRGQQSGCEKWLGSRQTVIVEPTGFADGWMWSIEKGAKGGLQGFSLGGGVLSAGMGGRSGLTGVGSQCSVQDTDKFALSVRQLMRMVGRHLSLDLKQKGLAWS